MKTTKILVVDDEKQICEVTKNFLTKRNYEVAVAFSKDEAISVFKDFKPALVLLDINLGASSGLDVLKEIKAFDKKAKIIMLTGHDKPEIIKEAGACGADDYILKPFTIDYLEKFVLDKISKLALKEERT